MLFLLFLVRKAASCRQDNMTYEQRTTFFLSHVWLAEVCGCSACCLPISFLCVLPLPIFGRRGRTCCREHVHFLMCIVLWKAVYRYVCLRVFHMRCCQSSVAYLQDTTYQMM